MSSTPCPSCRSTTEPTLQGACYSCNERLPFITLTMLATRNRRPAIIYERPNGKFVLGRNLHEVDVPIRPSRTPRALWISRELLRVFLNGNETRVRLVRTGATRVALSRHSASIDVSEGEEIEVSERDVLRIGPHLTYQLAVEMISPDGTLSLRERRHPLSHVLCSERPTDLTGPTVLLRVGRGNWMLEDRAITGSLLHKYWRDTQHLFDI